MLIWNNSYAETYEKYLGKYNVEFPAYFKQKLDQYDINKQQYNLKNKQKIKEVKMNKRLNTSVMTATDKNLNAPYVPYNKRRRTDTSQPRLDRIQTPRIPKKKPSQTPSTSKWDWFKFVIDSTVLFFDITQL